MCRPVSGQRGFRAHQTEVVGPATVGQRQQDVVCVRLAILWLVVIALCGIELFSLGNANTQAWPRRREVRGRFDVIGRELLRFDRAGDRWLIDPDMVIAYRMCKGKYPG